MGLAAVPFGTVQAEDCKIKVTQEYTCDPNDPKSEKDDAMHFRISVGEIGKDPHVADIVWPNDKEYPDPIEYPHGFMREYANELRTKKEVHDTFIRGYSDEILNALEFLYFRDEKNKSTGFLVRGRNFGGPNQIAFSFLKRHLMGHFHLRSEEEVERVCKLFEEGKRAIELVEEASDERIQSVQEAEGDRFEELRSEFYHRRLNLPKGCTCVMYYLDIGEKTCWFWLMRAPHGFTLALSLPGYKDGNLTVLSDVPTITWSKCNSLCSSNEILSTFAREFMWDNFLASSNYIKSKGLKLEARFFIRQGCRADEIELNGENASPDKCDYFVQTDPFGEKITDIWKKGKRLNMDGIKNRKFKDSKEIVKFLEEKFGKKEEAKK